MALSSALKEAAYANGNMMVKLMILLRKLSMMADIWRKLRLGRSVRREVMDGQISVLETTVQEFLDRSSSQ